MIGWLVGTRLGRLAAAIFGFVSVLFVAFLMGKREGKHVEKRKAKDNWIKTRKRMDEAPRTDDADGARDWLRKRQSKRDL